MSLEAAETAGRRPPRRRAWIGAVTRTGMLALALTVALTGCLEGGSPEVRALQTAFGRDRHGLSRDAASQVERFAAVEATLTADPDPAAIDHFTEVFRRVRADYIRPVSDAQLIDAAIGGLRRLEAAPRSLTSRRLVDEALVAMVGSLDPHSGYLNDEAFRETMISTSGEFGGLGIEVTQDGDRLRVVAPIEDTPAWRAGLKPGDVITHLDGVPVTGMRLMEAVVRMRGRSGTDIRLVVERADVPPFELTLTRAVIRIRPVTWRAEGDLGVIRITTFSRRTDDELREAMSRLRRQIGPSLRGIVLDLRGNLGGLLDQAVTVADDFLDGGTVVSVRGRRAEDEQVFAAKPGDLARDLPMVVLVNGISASASEIVAAALKDQKRAVVMGEPSYGKGTVQTIMPLSGTGAVRLTTAVYFAPSGRTIQGRGVVPDVVVATAQDARLKREADLPGALPADGPPPPPPQGRVDEGRCPAAGPAEDRTLGCAFALLKAPSVAGFLAAMGVVP